MLIGRPLAVLVFLSCHLPREHLRCLPYFDRLKLNQRTRLSSLMTSSRHGILPLDQISQDISSVGR